jgi:hypothetical protein
VAAHELTLNLVQAESFIMLTGNYGGLPFLAQDTAPGAPVPGTTDYNPLLPSNTTTYQGTIKVSINDIDNPSMIQILESMADADVSGAWLPEIQAFEDLNGNGEFGEDGLPPGGDSRPTSGDNPAPAAEGDYGVRIFHPAFGLNLGFGAYRDIVYNVTSGMEPVVGGLFSSLSQNFEFGTITPDPNDPDGTIIDGDPLISSGGWFDYWLAPAAGNFRRRSDNTGNANDNQSAISSSWTVTPLPGNQLEVRLFIPIDINAPGEDTSFFYDGQFVATAIVSSEPTDYNKDGIWDAADYVVWKKGLATGDYATWHTQFGESSVPGGSPENIPEPSSIVLIALATLGFGLRR